MLLLVRNTVSRRAAVRVVFVVDGRLSNVLLENGRRYLSSVGGISASKVVGGGIVSVGAVLEFASNNRLGFWRGLRLLVSLVLADGLAAIKIAINARIGLVKGI